MPKPCSICQKVQLFIIFVPVVVLIVLTQVYSGTGWLDEPASFFWHFKP